VFVLQNNTQELYTIYLMMYKWQMGIKLQKKSLSTNVR